MRTKLFPAIVVKGEYSGHKGLATAMNVCGDAFIRIVENDNIIWICTDILNIEYLD
jgi:hypothetical protein